CLGEHAGAPWNGLGGQATWGTLKIGLPDVDTGLGLAVLPAVAAGHFGRLDFAANDFGTDDLAGWLGRIAQPSGTGDADAARTLVTRQGTYTAAVSIGARLQSLSRPVERVAAEPVVEASVVLLT